MITLNDTIHALRNELTSFYLSHRERRRVERELKEARARRDAKAPGLTGAFLSSFCVNPS
ncbi:hypothetical protein CFR75_14215 [Komagataeibacter xylinus]|uniref:Uncharacterized protein n=1 Tax=Komagataeibacter xylinus TaxID=28448 RepID=A0A318PQT1_KOMXY|nr:hypothetical protein [Komagataeibacter xylinus]AZV37962.1 hypothetical protein CXP35_03215 [Komagataeibacter xylinus]PYD55833.1 hypothetical protein CFR75_14215 [Komagataeibacter xylinus]GBQ70366.1 hypothetical protein AA15237_0853 [Komagataeibacter xylinus NBRC 15237]